MRRPIEDRFVTGASTQRILSLRRRLSHATRLPAEAVPNESMPQNEATPETPDSQAVSGDGPKCGAPIAGPARPTPQQVRDWLGERICRQLSLYPMPEGLRISVVIPVYNERNSVCELIRRVRAVEIPKEILVVDDGSTDGTAEILEEMHDGEDLRVFRHQHNRGKGAALRTAFAHVTGDIVIIQDADLEYDPSQYPLLIQPIVEGVADVVYGSRFVTVGPHRVLYFWHWVANRVLTTVSNMFTDLNLTDMETGFKVFSQEAMQSIAPTLKEDRFGTDPELTAKLARHNWRFYELGISYFGRTYLEGKKIGLGDAFRVLWCILRYWKWD
jgi:glycosyltransferase involved in cell wall biosynthesis